MPAERLEADPRLAAVLACLELEAGATERAGRLLAHAEVNADSLPPRWRARHLDTIALAQLRAAQAEGCSERALEIAAELLDDGPARDGWSRPLRHAVAHLQLGVAGLWEPSPATAIDELHAALRLARAAGLPGVALAALGHLALTEVVHAGPLRAREFLDDALSEAAAHDPSADTAPTHVAAAAVALYERRFDTAEASVAAARAALAAGENAALAAVLDLVAAELDAAAGDTESALRRLDGLALRAGAACEPVIAAMRARMLVEQLGDHDGAKAALEHAAPTAAETEVAAARLHLAAGRSGRGAAGARARTLRHTPARRHRRRGGAADRDRVGAAPRPGGGRHRARGRARAGRRDRPPRRVPRRGPARRAACCAAGFRQRTAHPELVCDLLSASQHREVVVRSTAPLLEPLSERESMILRYLPTSLSNREIAGELFVTTNTVKTHLRSIYRKLGVAGRREAVERARALRITG